MDKIENAGTVETDASDARSFKSGTSYRLGVCVPAAPKRPSFMPENSWLCFAINVSLGVSFITAVRDAEFSPDDGAVMYTCQAVADNRWKYSSPHATLGWTDGDSFVQAVVQSGDIADVESQAVEERDPPVETDGAEG